MKIDQYFKRIIENDVIEGAWLFLSIDEETLFNEALDLANQITAAPYIYIVSDIEVLTDSIKNNYQVFDPAIKSIFEIQRLLFLASDEKKVVIIKLMEDLSEEAQNSLLKITEEPPSNAVFFFLSKDENRVLPTLLSRFRIIKIPEKNSFYQKRVSPEIKGILNSSQPLGVYLENFLEEDPVIFLENLAILARDGVLNTLNIKELKITNTSGKASAEDLKAILRALEGVKYHNLNPRLQIENVLLSLKNRVRIYK